MENRVRLLLWTLLALWAGFGGVNKYEWDLGELVLEGVLFPASMNFVGSNETLLLAGAGVRGMKSDGKFVVFTLSGWYLEERHIEKLRHKWRGKSAEQLLQSDEFFVQDLSRSNFKKTSRLVFATHLTGPEFAAKVTGKCKNILQKWGMYGDAEEQALQEFRDVFRDEDLYPGACGFFNISPAGLGIAVANNTEVVPATLKKQIGNAALAQAYMASVLGKHGVSPAARVSIASRLAAVFSDNQHASF